MRLPAVVMSMTVALCGVAVGCSDDGTTTAATPTVPVSSLVSTTLAPSSDGEAVVPVTTTQPTSDRPELTQRPADAGDYEGQKFDFGAITEVNRTGTSIEIVFNRQQLYTEAGKLQSGVQFNQEPIVYGNTDVPYVDDSPKTRRFVLSSDAVVLRIADPIPCASDEIIADPVWSKISVDDFVAGAWKDRLEDTLSFRSDGLVDQVRLSSGC